MNSPKHLWSGDWEQDSADAAARRAQAVVPALPEEQPPAEPEPTVRRGPSLGARLAGAASRLRAGLAALRRSKVPRLAALVALGVLVVAGGAYAITSLNHSTPATVRGATAWLGAQLESWPRGALVAAVTPSSPAQSAGLRPGDIITQVDGRPVASPVNVTEAIDVLRPGDKLTLQFQRGQLNYTTAATLTARQPGSTP
jgi:membrane-associated protease RseP (regulator of RpoE activity)